MQNHWHKKTRSLGQRLVSSALAVLTVLLLAALALPSRAIAQTPVQTDIGHLGGGSSRAFAVAGAYVAGTSLSGAGEYHAFVWSAATGMVDIAALLSSPYSAATSVNSRGEVVGGYYAPDYSSSTLFYWSQATGVVTISVGANFQQSPVLINESGVVAGTDNNGHVFRWTRTGGLQDLGGTGAGPYSIWVTAINARGDVIGNGGYAFVASASASTLTLLEPPNLDDYPPRAEVHMGGRRVEVSAINDNGVVVGTYYDNEYLWSGYAISQGGFFNGQVRNSHAFRWTLAGGSDGLD